MMDDSEMTPTPAHGRIVARVGPYLLQAAIAAVHAAAETLEATNWAEIVGLYDMLLRVTPSPVVEISQF